MSHETALRDALVKSVADRLRKQCEFGLPPRASWLGVLADELDAALAALPAAAPEPSVWQDISTAPKDGQPHPVVARRVKGDTPTSMWAYWSQRLEGWYRFGAGVPTRVYPTLWMPLPSPPLSLTPEATNGHPQP